MPSLPRFSVVLASLLLTAAAAAPGGGPAHRRYGVVVVEPMETTAYLATITATFHPFVLRSGAYVSEYDVQVFPFYFFSEHGQVSIPISDADLADAEGGKPVVFHGSGHNQKGQRRTFDGRLVPTGRGGGRIFIRVRVSHRISVAFSSTYSLPGGVAKPTGSR